MKNLKLINYLLIIKLILLTNSCQDDELSFQENFPFEVIIMPIREEIQMGQTAEIRISIQTEQVYHENQYFIRYFQFEGIGELRYYEDEPYMPNDLYPLLDKEFRLYYTSQSEDTQDFSIWISDNFGNENKIDFQLKNESGILRIAI